MHLMKNRLPAAFLGLALLAGSALLLHAVPLTMTTAVQTRPDPAAPAITYFKAGTEPTPSADSLATAPAGWMAVELAGPFEGYVMTNDITKSLDVRPGAAIHLEPKPDSTVLTTMAKGDKTEITGMPRGKWMQIQLEKKITGYIRISAPAPLPPIATAPVVYAAPMTPPLPTSGSTAVGKPAPMVDLGDGGAGALPRLFQGKFVSTHRPFAPRRPYDYQLNDDAGVRFAYLDVSQLTQTEKFELYLDHTVAIYGTAKTVPEAGGLVIKVESVQVQ
jgi:hypothetical protein